MTVEMGNRLTELRRRAELSQEMLAEQLQVSRQAVSKWERGEACPDMENLIMLSRLYGVSLDMLLRGQEWEDGDTPQQDDGPGEEGPQEEPAREDRKKSSKVPSQDGVYKRKMGLAWLQEYPLTNLGVSLLFAVLWFGTIFFGWKVFGNWNFSDMFYVVNSSFPFGNFWGVVYILPWIYRMMRSAMGKGAVYQEHDSSAGKFFKLFPYAFFMLLLHVVGLTFGHSGWWLIYATIPIYEWIVQSIFGYPVSRCQIALSFPVSSCVLCFCCFLSICDGSFWPYFLLILIPIYYAVVIGIWAKIKKKDFPPVMTKSIK